MSSLQEQARKRTVGRHEVYLRTHKKQKGKGPFVDNKSALVEEKYKEMLVQAHGPEVLDDETYFDATLWAEAVGGDNKGRLYGCGSTGLVTRPRVSIESSAASSSSLDSQAVLEERIRNRVREEMQQEMNAKLAALLDEKMKDQEEQMRKRDEKLDALMKALNVRVDPAP